MMTYESFREEILKSPGPDRLAGTMDRRVKVKILLEKHGRFVLGSGRARLLELIDSTHSISRAAEVMEMSYRHAWGNIKELEESLGRDVVTSTRGGKSGGGTCLTRYGRTLLKEYQALRSQVDAYLALGPSPRMTVDGIVIRKNKVLLVQRKRPPFKGQYALPGGFVEYGEGVELAVVREMEEETGLRTKVKRLVGVYSRPDRDPRGHTVTAAYLLAHKGGKVKAGSDAADAKWFSLDKLPELAFDHAEILADAVRLA